MVSKAETLELMANNLANVSTTAFKADRAFYRLFTTAQAKVDPLTDEQSWVPVTQASRINFQQGPLEATGNSLDVALEGTGFLVVDSPAGVLFTRQGSLDRSADGVLRTAEGYPVLDTEGQWIEIPPTGSLEIGPRGHISIDGLRSAQIALLEFDGEPPLQKAGDTYFQLTGEDTSQAAESTKLRHGYLEGSNVSPPEAMVGLIELQRGFEMLRQAASLINNEMNGRAVDELGRASG